MKFPLKALSLAAASLFAAGSLHAGTASSATGNWSDSGTWNNGMPVNGAAVGIVNGATVTMQSGDSYTSGGFPNGLTIGTVGDLWGGFTGSGSGTLNVTGGNLTTSWTGIGRQQLGTLNISGGAVALQNTLALGWELTSGSSINVSGGSLTLSGDDTAAVGWQAAASLNVSGTGTVNLNRELIVQNASTVGISGGSFVASNTTGKLNVSNGAVTQSGGSVTFGTGEALWLGGGAGTGTYNLSGGTFTANGLIRFGVFGSGTGIFNQSGGTAELSSVAGWNGAQAGAYNLQGGTLKARGNLLFDNVPGFVAALNITGSAGNVTVDTDSFNIEAKNSSTFNNAAATLSKIGNGTLTIAGGLNIQNGALTVGNGTLETSSTITIGSASGTATGSISGGTLKTGILGDSNFVLGDNGTGTFTQTGGAVDIGSRANMVLGWGGGTGTYNMNGGTYSSAGTTYVGLFGGSRGTLNLNGGTFNANNLTLAAGSAASGILNIAGGSLNVSGVLSVETNGVININSGGTLGKLATIQNGGVVNVNTGGVLAGGATVNDGGLLKFNGGNGAGVVGKYVTLNGGTVDVNGQNIADLTWDAVISSAPGSKIANSSATAATINNTVSGNTIWLWDGAGTNTTIETVGNLTIHSWITDTNQSISQGITKTGAGTLDLTYGGNNYRGGTRVSAGTLLVSNLSGSATGTGAVTVEAGGTLGGSGTIGGATTINSGGTLAPGSSIESLGTGALSFSNGSALALELNSSVATSVGADLVVVNGNLSLDNPGTITLTLTDLAVSPAAFALGTKFSLINYSGTWNNGLFTYGAGTLADGEAFVVGLNTWQIDYNATSGGVNFTSDYRTGSFVNIEAVPEPSTYALLAFAAAGLGAHVIRRRRR
jgi:autotransporter-associated beta strand protein